MLESNLTREKSCLEPQPLHTPHIGKQRRLLRHRWRSCTKQWWDSRYRMCGLRLFLLQQARRCIVLQCRQRRRQIRRFCFWVAKKENDATLKRSLATGAYAIDHASEPTTIVNSRKPTCSCTYVCVFWSRTAYAIDNACLPLCKIYDVCSNTKRQRNFFMSQTWASSETRRQLSWSSSVAWSFTSFRFAWKVSRHLSAFSHRVENCARKNMGNTDWRRKSNPVNARHRQLDQKQFCAVTTSGFITPKIIACC